MRTKSRKRARAAAKESRRTRVIAVRVPESLHERIAESAKLAERSMREEMEWLLARCFEWRDTFGEREKMLEDARKTVQEASAQARRIVPERLIAELRKANWKKEADTGKWVPPEVHGLPPNGFGPGTAAEWTPLDQPAQRLDPELVAEIKALIVATLKEQRGAA